MNAASGNHLLMLVHRIPYPPDKGDKIRSFHEFRFLCSKGWKIHLCTFMDDPSDIAHTEWLRSKAETAAFFPLPKLRRYAAMATAFWTGKPLSVGAFHVRGARQYVRRVMNQYPVKSVLCFSSPMAEYLFHLGCAPKGVGAVMDLVDVDSDKWRLYAEKSSGFRRWIYKRECRLLAAYEKKIAASFRAVVVVSEAEGRFLKSRTGCGRVCAVANGVDTAYFHPRPADFQSARDPDVGVSVVFCGLMDYYPNVDAVKWFVASVLPLLRKRLGKVTFHVVGARPTKAVVALGTVPGVVVHGRVDDVRPYVWGADVSVAPLRVARGIQNKVLEAMAMAKPVVATDQAFEGIEAVSGRELMVANADPEAFSEAIVAVRQRPDAAREMGKHARALVESKYDWNARLETLHAVLMESGD